ncbi:MAG: mechanosensitive ion channel family protein [Gemmatimonas sp.]
MNASRLGRNSHSGLRFASPKYLCVFSVILFALVAHALPGQLGLLKQGAKTPAATTAAASIKAEPDSPRASYEYFTRLGSDGEWDKAALYLTLTPEQSKRGAELAQRLKLVLDQRLAIVSDSLSPASAGDTTDQSLENDRLGIIIGPSGLPEAVLMTRVDESGLARWVFAASTVNATDYWFSKLAPPWLSNRLPAGLMREGPLHVLWWQWIGLAIALPLLFVLSLGLSWLVRALLGRVAARTATDWDDQLLERLRGPFRLWIGAIAAGPILGILDLNTRVSGLLDATARGLVLLALFWALLRVIRLAQDHLVSTAWTHGQSQARTLVPLLGNFLRVTLAIFALLVALSQFGYPVSSLLAGLGIGGIAIALAAQKTVEHLFGSVSLAADKAFRVGDFVRVGTLEGTVERIGLRSTSFRTHERTIVRVPNGKLAEERIETFGARDRIFFRVDLGVTYDTSPEDLTKIRAEILAHLRRQPKIWPDQIHVHVIGFGDSAIRLRVSAWFLTTEYVEFLEIRNDVLMEFMRIVERHGSSFAYPTRTVHHVMEGTAPIPGTLPVDASQS